MTAIYARVSTEEQARKGYSLKDQVRACRKLAYPDECVEFIDEGVSGEFLERPGLSALRQALREGRVEKVVCLDPDRLSRRLVNQLILSEEIEKKARLLFVNGEYGQTAEGRLFYQLRGAISEFEKAKINERMSRGRHEKARQGKVIRDYNIFGYDYDEKSGSMIVNEFEALTVKRIFDCFTGKSGKSVGINGIARLLNESAVPTKRGAGIWHRQVVRQILMNSAYTGEFYQNRWNCAGMLGNKNKLSENRIRAGVRPREEWIPTPCPAIIDRAQFEYAGVLLAQARRRWAGAGRNEYLLSGLVRCAVCGNTMTGRRAKNWGKPVFEYSDVKRTEGARNKGCGRRIGCSDLDGVVWNEVSRYLKDNLGGTNSGFNACIPDTAGENAEIEILEKRLQQIKKKIQGLINSIPVFSSELDSSIIEELKSKLACLKREENALSDRIAGLKLRQEAPGRGEASGRSAAPADAAGYYLQSGNERLSFEDKKQLIRFLVREILVAPDEIRICLL